MYRIYLSDRVNLSSGDNRWLSIVKECGVGACESINGSDIFVISIDNKDLIEDELQRIKSLNSYGKIIGIASCSNYNHVKTCIKYNIDEFILIEEFFSKIQKAINSSVEKLDKDNSKSSASKNFKNTVNIALNYIYENYNKELTLKGMADDIGVSSWHLCRCLKNETGKSYIELLLEYRFNIAKKLLKTTNLQIYEICSCVGIVEQTYFNSLFKKMEGKTPLEYRQS